MESDHDPIAANDRTEIGLNWIRYIWGVCFLGSFVAVSLLALIIIPPSISLRNSVLLAGLTAIFAITIAEMLLKMISNQPALVIDSLGIIDDCSLVAAGRISWSDISGISTVKTRQTKMIVITLRDPDRILDHYALGFFIQRRKSDR